MRPLTPGPAHALTTAPPLCSFNAPLQSPPLFLLPAVTRPTPHPSFSGSMSSDPTPSRSFPGCPRCQFLSARAPGFRQSPSLTGSLLGIWGGLSCSLPVPINRPQASQGLGLHQIQLFLSLPRSLGSNFGGCSYCPLPPSSLPSPLGLFFARCQRETRNEPTHRPCYCAMPPGTRCL